MREKHGSPCHKCNHLLLDVVVCACRRFLLCLTCIRIKNNARELQRPFLHILACLAEAQ